MLGTIVLIALQMVGSWWLSKEIINRFPYEGLLKVILLVVVIALVVWIIGILGSEFIKDVAKPTTNALMSALFVAALVVGVNYLPLFKEYAVHIRVTYLQGLEADKMPILGAVIGYYMSK